MAFADDIASSAVAAVRAAGRPLRSVHRAVEASPYGQPGPEMATPDLGPWDYSPGTAAVNLGLRILADARGRANWRAKQKATEQARALDAEYKRAQIGKLRSESVPDASDQPVASFEYQQPLPSGIEGPPEMRQVGLTKKELLTHGDKVGLFQDQGQRPATPSRATIPSRLFSGEKVTPSEAREELDYNLRRERFDEGKRRFAVMQDRANRREGAELKFPTMDYQTMQQSRGLEAKAWENAYYDDTNASFQAAKNLRMQTEKRIYTANIPRFVGSMGLLARQILHNPDLATDTDLLKAIDAAIKDNPADLADDSVGQLLTPLYAK